MDRRKTGALLAATSVGGAVAVWALAFRHGETALLDGRLLDGFRHRAVPGIGALDTERIVWLVDPKPFVLASELLIAAALVRRRLAVAAAIAGILGCANLTSQILKPLLADPRGWSVGAEAWPSGHATAAMTLGLCAVLAVPRRWRPVAAAGGAAFAVGVGGSILLEGVHFPSDVLAGYLVAGAWTGVAVVALEATRRRGLRLARPRLAAGATVASAVAAGATVAVWQRDALARFAVENTKFVVVAGAIALGTTAVIAAMQLPRRRLLA